MHYMSEQHADILRQMTGKAGDADLDDVVTQTYWDYKRIMDRAGAPIGVEGLALIIFLANKVERVPQDMQLKFAPELYQDGKLKVGDLVEATWRKKQVQAVFIGITGNGQCKLEINGKEQTVPAEDVVVPEHALV